MIVGYIVFRMHQGLARLFPWRYSADSYLIWCAAGVASYDMSNAVALLQLGDLGHDRRAACFPC